MPGIYTIVPVKLPKKLPVLGVRCTKGLGKYERLLTPFSSNFYHSVWSTAKNMFPYHVLFEIICACICGVQVSLNFRAEYEYESKESVLTVEPVSTRKFHRSPDLCLLYNFPFAVTYFVELTTVHDCALCITPCIQSHRADGRFPVMNE